MRTFLLLACAGLPLMAHDVITTKVTWTREISRIVYKRCASCHHPGGSAFSLLSYEEARPWAVAIKEEVLARRMPPWAAVKGFGDFRNDTGLTYEEIELVTDWVVGGAPNGDSNLAPPLPDFKSKAASAPRPGAILVVRDGAVLKRDLMVTAIRPEQLAEGSGLRVIAQRTDGQLDPLIWLYNYQARFAQTYYLRAPLRLPAGTRIRMDPEAAGAIALIARPVTVAGRLAR